jgi:hypothetical protein
MTALHRIDDLTGALDNAAEFVGMTGPVPVFWAGAIPSDLARSSAVDSGTRPGTPTPGSINFFRKSCLG